VCISSASYRNNNGKSKQAAIVAKALAAAFVTYGCENGVMKWRRPIASNVMA